MSVARVCKPLAAAALLAGLFGLLAPENVWAANKAEEAKKHTETLKSGKASTKDKVTALTELGDLGRLMKSLVTDAMPSMTAALKDKDASVRMAAAKAIGKCDPDASVADALADLVKNDKDEGVKVAAMQGLAAMGPNAKSAVPAIRAVQKDNDKKTKLGKTAGDTLKAINMKKS